MRGKGTSRQGDRRCEAETDMHSEEEGGTEMSRVEMSSERSLKINVKSL